jgi:hypothetical protein
MNSEFSAKKSEEYSKYASSPTQFTDVIDKALKENPNIGSTEDLITQLKTNKGFDAKITAGTSFGKGDLQTELESAVAKKGKEQREAERGQQSQQSPVSICPEHGLLGQAGGALPPSQGKWTVYSDSNIWQAPHVVGHLLKFFLLVWFVDFPAL